MFRLVAASMPPVHRFAAPLLLSLVGFGCTSHHWARVESSDLPPPRAHELHSTRLIVDTSRVSEANQCVVHAEYSPVCFFDLKPSLERALVRSTWPAFPQVTLDRAERARPGDYVLQVEVLLDALPPDSSGPGWSAGAKSRFRLVRDGKVLHEETLSSRSTAEFPYGAPLGQGASQVLDATVRHIAERVSAVPETRQSQLRELPQVAAHEIVTQHAVAQAASPAAEKSSPVEGGDDLAKSVSTPEVIPTPTGDLAPAAPTAPTP